MLGEVAEIERRRRNGSLGAAILRWNASCQEVGRMLHEVVTLSDVLCLVAATDAVDEAARFSLGTTILDAFVVAYSI
jgi:hypothetical protein